MHYILHRETIINCIKHYFLYTAPVKLWPHDTIEILIIIFFYPLYQGSRGVWKKIRRKCVGVTITPGSPQTQKNHVAARRWIAALDIIIIIIKSYYCAWLK